MSVNVFLVRICIENSMVAYFCKDLSDDFVTFLNKFSQLSTLKNAKSRRKQLYLPPDTVMSPAGYSYVTQETVISPSRVFVLHTN